MGRIEKTVFISYRRTNVPWALAIFQDLTQHGYDVFFDFTGLASGDFETVILENVRARAHFLVLLTPSSLERCGDRADWLRREVEAALESRRNIVPLMLEGFNFATPAIGNQLTGKLAVLKHYNGMSVPPEYFDAAMEKLRDKFLNVRLDAVLHPTSLAARRAATKEQRSARKAPVVGGRDLKVNLWIVLGRNARRKGDPYGAIEYYSKVIRLKPKCAEAFHDRGNARFDTGDLEGAFQDYNKAIRLKPGLAEAFLGRGIARYAKCDLEGALQDYNEAIRLNPDYVFAFSNRGVLRSDQGDLEGALEDFGQAIRLKPDYANAFNNRGYARSLKGDLAGALQDYEQAIRLRPDYPDALRNRDDVRKAIAKAKANRSKT